MELITTFYNSCLLPHVTLLNLTPSSYDIMFHSYCDLLLNISWHEVLSKNIVDCVSVWAWYFVYFVYEVVLFYELENGRLKGS